MTIGFPGDEDGEEKAAANAPLYMGHQYAVDSVTRDSSGAVISITLRNPWGHNGEFFDRKGVDGALVTLSPSKIFAQEGQVNWGRV